jgi:hypothetical protein
MLIYLGVSGLLKILRVGDVNTLVKVDLHVLRQRTQANVPLTGYDRARWSCLYTDIAQPVDLFLRCQKLHS